MPRLGETAKGAAPLLEDQDRASQDAQRRILPCRGCGARMFFVTGPNGRLMPLNAELSTIAVRPEDDAQPWALVRGYIPHHITCPDRDKFRKPRP